MLWCPIPEEWQRQLHHCECLKLCSVSVYWVLFVCYRQKLSSTVPGRVLTPAVSRCYARLLAHRQHSALGPLLSVLADSFSTLTRSELTQLVPDLTTFFMSALQFRADCAGGASEVPVSQDDIEQAEGYVVEAVVVLILKLSESTFRPLYYTLFHWATSSEAHKYRVITFYR